MNLGLVLKRSGDTAGAEGELRRAIDLDSSLKQAYIELATLYAANLQWDQATGIISRYLEWNPQDVLFRLQKARLAGRQ